MEGKTEQNLPNTPVVGGGKNTTMAIIAYIIFFVPLLTGDAKKDPFVKYHTKQGLVLFFLMVLINVIGWIIPFYFWYTFSWILSLGVLVLLIIGISNAVGGKEQPLPVIGKFADMFKF
ncbi:hypothetical protein KJ785_01100 [Patescibacteria group bacterium]|nr:hypothetical protein [Patescibacteria group bacterium]